MPRIKIKTSNTSGATPAAGSLETGELAVNVADRIVFIGDESNNPVKIVDSMGQQDEDNITITGGAINNTNITATSLNATNIQLSNSERLYYDEGTNAASFTGNWNNATTFNMTDFGGLGNVTAHGWDTGPANYTLTLNNLPTHTQVRYEVFWHMVGSLDDEPNELFVTNSAGSEVRYAYWTKPFGPPANLNLASGTTFSWIGNRWYSDEPWGGSGRVLDNNGGNGYAIVNTGWINHTASSISVRHYIGANQPRSDESGYLSHVKLWIRGADSNAITTISTDAALGTSSTALSTQSAIKSYIDTNLSRTVKNVYVYTGNTTYNKSGDDVKLLRVICVGGGGGGRGYGESGGAGGYAERIIDATAISSVGVTVGGGGAGGFYFGFSGRGGTTSFGSYVSADGGFGANNHGAHIGGHGGIGYGGQVVSRGGGGKGHNNGANNPSNSAVGWGGASFFGGSRNSHHGSGRPANVGPPGGGGAGSVGYSGGIGSDGLGGCVIVYELY